MDKCTTCERAFHTLADYPLVYLMKVTRQKIPDGMKFPFESNELLLHPSVKALNNKIPQAVADIFLKDPQKEVVEYDGWNWHRDDLAVPDLGTKKSAHRLENIVYHKSQDDQKETILAQLEPYLATLESFVGREVEMKQVLPPFSRDSYFTHTFNIPNTGYGLKMNEVKKERDYRYAQLVILGEGPNMGSAGGPTLEQVATIATIKYEGRTRR